MGYKPKRTRRRWRSYRQSTRLFHGHFPIHRRVVQHQTPSFRAGVPEPQRVRTPRGSARQAGPQRRSRPQPNRPRALPDRPAGDPEQPSTQTLNVGLRERFPSTGYRPPQGRRRQPSTVHRIGLTPNIVSVATSGSALSSRRTCATYRSSIAVCAFTRREGSPG